MNRTGAGDGAEELGRGDGLREHGRGAEEDQGQSPQHA
jgi:hypothetical protein